jgi:hypothetical protein
MLFQRFFVLIHLVQDDDRGHSARMCQCKIALESGQLEIVRCRHDQGAVHVRGDDLPFGSPASRAACQLRSTGEHAVNEWGVVSRAVEHGHPVSHCGTAVRSSQPPTEYCAPRLRPGREDRVGIAMLGDHPCG